MTSRLENQLSYLNDEMRYKIYQNLISGCTHLYSKNKIQFEKLKPVLEDFMVLAEKDPYFLAHVTSYLIKNSDNKDLKVLSVFANSLSDADGTPFYIGSEYVKPNLRIVSQAAIQKLDPKLVNRVLEIANIKQKLGTKRLEATHLARSLTTAIKKYLKFRENNPDKMKKSGFTKTFKELYRKVHLAPSYEAASYLGWKQKSGEEIKQVNLINFDQLHDIEIAKKIRNEQIPVQTALGALQRNISPVIAVALLEQASGNQALILQSMWDGQSILKDKEVLLLFENKLQSASQAIDRVEKITSDLDNTVKSIMNKAKSEKRKEDVGDFGKVFIHIDASPSMNKAIEFAKEKGAIFAEAISNPKENFYWGYFQAKGKELKRPKSFEKDAFLSALYGLQSGGYGTDCVALYEKARKLGCEIDIYFTDCEHNQKSISETIQKCDRKGFPRPKAAVVVKFGSGRRIGGWGYGEDLTQELEKLQIPVVEVEPSSLSQSALVSQTIKQALMGPQAVLDAIMETPLLRLPKWWAAVKV